MSEETEPPARSAIPAEVEVEIQRHINELRREQMDDRDTYFDRLLAIVAIVIAVAGYFSFKQFREIKAEAGQNVMASKQYAEEARHLVEKIKAKQHEADSLVERISAQTVADKPSEANQVVSNVRKNPEASPIQKSIGLAVSFQQQGKRDDAIEKWSAVAHITEGSDNDLAAIAWFSVGYLLQDEDLEGAVSAYDRAIRLNPGYVEAYNNRGNTKLKLGKYEAAVTDYDEAIRLDPALAKAYSNRGATKRALGQYEAAIADCNEAIRLDPDGAEAYINRAAAKHELGQNEAAIADCNEAIRLDPDSAEAYNNRGAAKHELGQYEAAIADCNEAIRLDPDLVTVSDSGFVLPQLVLGGSPVDVGFGPVRVQADRLVTVSDSGFVLPQLVLGGTSVVVGLRGIRVQADRLVTVTDSGFVLPYLIFRVAPVVVGSGIARVQPDRFVIVGDGGFVLL